MSGPTPALHHIDDEGWAIIWCPNCGGLFRATTPHNNNNKVYCTKKCRASASEARRIQQKQPCYIKKLEYKREHTKKRTKRHIKEGVCSRCGHENDRLDEGRKVCSACIQQIRASGY